ncbi:MAG: ribonuclease III [Limnothrix sp. RL_2_0]|nr:ribonuclease III [Limnothrix sp. RL_2_0]
MTSLPFFRRSPLLTQALTHSSYVNEHPEVGESNERLEFLGDAVLKFVMGKLLYERYPQFQEGELSRLRASLENNRHQLASFALDLGLDQLLLLGKGTAKVGARKNPEILSDVFEAVVGAYFLDAGIEAAIAFIEALVIPVADQIVQQPEAAVSQNPKGELQEWALANYGEIPQYKTIQESGADHDKTFTVVVTIQGDIYAQGIGQSKKLAQKAAAQEALQKLTKQESVTSNERLELLQSLANQI